MRPRLKTYVLLFIAVILLTPIVYGQKVGDCLSGNCENGKGVKLLDKKDKYEGEFVNGKMEGVGIIWTKKNNVREMGLYSIDQFVEHFYVGRKAKTVHYSNGDTYWGEIVNEMREGEGIYQWKLNAGAAPKDYKRFNGNWSQNKMNGYGTIVYADGTKTNVNMINGKTEADYKKSQLNPIKLDYTKIDYSDGGSYEGGMLNDDKQGFGILKFPDGKKYIGSFNKNIIDGVGVFYEKNGTVLLTGRFSNNVLTQSYQVSDYTMYTINYPTGGTYVGQLLNGKRNGEGVYFFDINKKEEVHLPHMGLIYYNNEASLDGTWKDNQATGNMTMKYVMHNYSEQEVFEDEDSPSFWKIFHDQTITLVKGKYVSNYFEGFGSKEVYMIFEKGNKYHGISKYIGNLKSSMPHGNGKLFDWVNGAWSLKYDGEFSNGNYIGPSK